MTMTQWYPKIAEYDYDGWATFDYMGREFHAPFSDFDVTIKINKDYVVGAGGILENPTEVKGYDAAAKIKTEKDKKATWKWTAKNILDFAWSADRDYSVESFNVPKARKCIWFIRKMKKLKYGGSTALYYQVFPDYEQSFREICLPNLRFHPGR